MFVCCSSACADRAETVLRLPDVLKTTCGTSLERPRTERVPHCCSEAAARSDHPPHARRQFYVFQRYTMCSVRPPRSALPMAYPNHQCVRYRAVMISKKLLLMNRNHHGCARDENATRNSR